VSEADKRSVRLVVVPVDSGFEGVRMGAGPEALIAAGLIERLADDGADVQSVRLGVPPGWHAELRTTFALHHEVAAQSRAAAKSGRSTLILAGNCNAAVGALAALDGSRPTGLIWMDAHADFNTPETDARGNLDGQGLAIATGRAWAAHTHALDGFHPVAEHRVLLVGARDFDDEERAALDASSIRRLSVEDSREPNSLGLELDEFCSDVERIHLHIDADVLDPSLGRANGYASPGGMMPADVTAVIHAARIRQPIVSASIAAWDPAEDATSDLVHVLVDLARVVAGSLGYAADPHAITRGW
jgi:arginase